MVQAAADDYGANSPFGYGIVGHDIDRGGLDGEAQSTCCQCYQLVFDLPESAARNSSGGAGVPIPRPLIVQAFNTAAGGGSNFDIFMGAGGFGVFNACDPQYSQQPSPSGAYLYSTFPDLGEPFQGGVNAGSRIDACRSNNQVTAESLSTPACQSAVKAACNEITSDKLSAQALADSVNSCITSNAPDNYVHINWEVYVKKVECPAHLTLVTGCKLAPQGLPAPDPNVTRAEQAAADSSFRKTTAGGERYTTTTMQDCCKPSCSWQDWVTGSNGNLKAIDKYNSFYTCDATGEPLTE